MFDNTIALATEIEVSLGHSSTTQGSLAALNDQKVYYLNK